MTAPTVARLSTPGDLLAVVPALCGFAPAESLVVLSLRGPRRRVGLTARVDLPRDDGEPLVAELFADRVQADGAADVAVAVYSELGRRERLVTLLGQACEERSVGVLSALHVAGGCWTSYSCALACCPPSGTPVPTSSAVAGLVAAEQAATGRVVLGSREELVRSLAPPDGAAAVAARQRTAEATATWSRSRVEHGASAARRATLEHARALLDRVEQGGQVGATDAAVLAVGLADVAARDGLATLAPRRSDGLLSLLLQVAGQVAPPDDAATCALLGWVAYGRGDGALANVALDRALASAPDHGLALLLRACLDGGVPPDAVRASVRSARRRRRRR
jgi:hypothetical protein